VRLRLAAPALGAIGLLVSLAGAGGAASLLLLAAIAAASAHLLERVGEVAEEGDGRLPAVVSGLSLALLVAAGATATPALALGVLLLLGVEELADDGAEGSMDGRNAQAQDRAAELERSRAA